ncbi:MAG: TldD/PmbA family protein [Alphaproteobacteria bacterium]|nr:MAG: TldD/PmbA family protein [Alphaproteobacteria bacterium]
MKNNLESIAAALVEVARKAGADQADALAVEGTSIGIDVLNGKLEAAERSEGIDVGLRVIVGNRQACVSASDTAGETLRQMAERAVAMAREAPEDPSVGLAAPEELAHDWDLAALELEDPTAEPDPATLEEDARRAEAAALSVGGVTKVQSASASYGRQRLHLCASNGFSGGYARTSRSVSCVAITGEGLGMERDFAAESRVFQADLPAPEDVGREAGERAVARRDPRRPPTGRFPVVFDERVAATLIGHLLSAVNGTAIVRGASWARDLLGKTVLPEGISLYEEPHRPRIPASRPFDAEGLATRRRAIVEDGILTGWTLDLSTARRLGLESTANAVRSTGSPPSPGVGNVTLTPGEHDREALLREIGEGLLVTSLIGSTINPTTGDYSRGAAGFWIEGGEIRHPVNELTIAGNLLEMLRSITPANDARPHKSRLVPSLAVEGLTIAGD